MEGDRHDRAAAELSGRDQAGVGKFLTRYRELEPLRITCGELEMYVRSLEGHGYAPATISRRFTTVATFYRYAVIDGVIAVNPADAVTRPNVPWEGQKRTVLPPLEFAALLAAARGSDPVEHALVALLGMIGLRVSEACNADITDLRYQGGYEILHVLGKGSKPADIPLPIPVLRAVREATVGRSSGPILLNRANLDRQAAHAVASYLAGMSHD